MLRTSTRLFLRTYVTEASKKSSTVDSNEVSKFASQAAKWWHPDGSAAPLHRMNPTRVAYIRSLIEKHLKPVPIPSQKPLASIDVLDVGCGGGLVTEPIARLGANVLGIDMSEEGLAVARIHAAKDPALVASNNLQYRHAAVEHLENQSENFDVVLALEIIEHVSDPKTFIRQCSSLVREGGVLILSTLNRTLASYALAIVAAERILQWLPPGTHEWSKFPKPEELSQIMDTETNLIPDALVGVTMNPLSGTFSITNDTNINYILSATQPARPPSKPTSDTPKADS